MNQVLISEAMQQDGRQDDEEQLKTLDVRGECFAPHLALMLKSEWHKWCEALSSDTEGRGSLREDLGRGLGFAILHSNSALLFDDVLTTGGKSEYTISIDK